MEKCIKCLTRYHCEGIHEYDCLTNDYMNFKNDDTVNTTMKTWEAVKLLEEGKFVRRTSWEEKNDHLFLNEKGSIRHSRGFSSKIENKVLDDNWEEYKPGGEE